MRRKALIQHHMASVAASLHYIRVTVHGFPSVATLKKRVMHVALEHVAVVCQTDPVGQDCCGVTVFDVILQIVFSLEHLIAVQASPVPKPRLLLVQLVVKVNVNLFRKRTRSRQLVPDLLQLLTPQDSTIIPAHSTPCLWLFASCCKAT